LTTTCSRRWKLPLTLGRFSSSCSLTLARLRAVARRSAILRPETLRAADLELNTANHTASRGGRAISLTAKEYALLEFLMLNQGRVVGREQIGQHVWDENFDPFSNTIDVHVKRLRAKIDAGFSRTLIHTRRGEGYLFSAGEDDD
jgi:two-component system, OmpR family, copper resistance phosphate regulon response regulator CusR